MISKKANNEDAVLKISMEEYGFDVIASCYSSFFILVLENAKSLHKSKIKHEGITIKKMYRHLYRDLKAENSYFQKKSKRKEKHTKRWGKFIKCCIMYAVLAKILDKTPISFVIANTNLNLFKTNTLVQKT